MLTGSIYKYLRANCSLLERGFEKKPSHKTESKVHVRNSTEHGALKSCITVKDDLW